MGQLQLSGEKVSGFTGVFVRRHDKPGQKYTQLVFETAEGMRLSLTNNATMVRGLTVGRKYYVSGQKYAIGAKTCIYDPVATPVEETAKFMRRHIRAIGVTGILMAVVGVSGAAYAMTVDNATHAPVASSAKTSEQPAKTAASATEAPIVSTSAPATATDSKATTAAASNTTTPRATPPVKRSVAPSTSAVTAQPIANTPVDQTAPNPTQTPSGEPEAPAVKPPDDSAPVVGDEPPVAATPPDSIVEPPVPTE